MLVEGESIGFIWMEIEGRGCMHGRNFLTCQIDNSDVLSLNLDMQVTHVTICQQLITTVQCFTHLIGLLQVHKLHETQFVYLKKPMQVGETLYSYCCD